MLLQSSLKSLLSPGAPAQEKQSCHSHSRWRGSSVLGHIYVNCLGKHMCQMPCAPRSFQALNIGSRGLCCGAKTLLASACLLSHLVLDAAAADAVVAVADAAAADAVVAAAACAGAGCPGALSRACSEPVTHLGGLRLLNTSSCTANSSSSSPDMDTATVARLSIAVEACSNENRNTWG
jgi:hypothetical protein